MLKATTYQHNASPKGAMTAFCLSCACALPHFDRGGGWCRGGGAHCRAQNQHVCKAGQALHDKTRERLLPAALLSSENICLDLWSSQSHAELLRLPLLKGHKTILRILTILQELTLIGTNSLNHSKVSIQLSIIGWNLICQGLRKHNTFICLFTGDQRRITAVLACCCYASAIMAVATTPGKQIQVDSETVGFLNFLLRTNVYGMPIFNYCCWPFTRFY